MHRDWHPVDEAKDEDEGYLLAATPVNENIRYEPEDRLPIPVAVGVGFQAAAITLPAIALTVVIVARVADQSESYIQWGVFAALLISGITTVLQAARVWRIGSGHVLLMGTSGAFIAVCIAALKVGGSATMASLIIVSSLFQFLLAARLSLLRRIFTPVVTGTVIMLIAATVMPFVFEELNNVPGDASGAAAPVTVGVALAIVGTLVLRAPPSLRLWSPLIGVVVGCAVSAPFGLYDVDLIVDASWIGVPFTSWPGLEFTPGHEFWALLPAFVVVTLVGAIETIGDGVAIQRVSRRKPRATDFRVVQGALNTDGLGNLLSGIAGTLPNTTYSSSISLAQVTGIAARRVGIAIGVVFMVVAFFPKVAALVLAIPGPVAAAYVTILIGLLFVQGMKIVIEDGIDHRKAPVAGLAFWIGAGFQNGWILPQLLGDGFVAVLLGNGMTSGALVAVAMVAFLELTRPKRGRLQVALDSEALPKVDKFLRQYASGKDWNPASQDRLASAGEETLAILMQDGNEARPFRLTVTASSDGNSAEIEFATSLEGENVEDYLAHLRSLPPPPPTSENSPSGFCSITRPQCTTRNITM